MDINCKDAEQSKHLPIVIEGKTFKPNSEGLWSLTEINKALPELTKAPAQWRGRERDYFERCANLHSVNGDQGGTWATERATIAYAMACSLDFYVMVVDAFVIMRNDAILSARMSSLALAKKDKLLADNMPKASALMRKAAGHGISWTDACRAAKIKQPGLAKQYLLAIKKFCKTFDHDLGVDVIRPSPRAFKLGYFKRHVGPYGSIEGWKVSDRGVNWLEKRADKINAAIQERNMRVAMSRRGKQEVLAKLAG